MHLVLRLELREERAYRRALARVNQVGCDFRQRDEEIGVRVQTRMWNRERGGKFDHAVVQQEVYVNGTRIGAQAIHASHFFFDAARAADHVNRRKRGDARANQGQRARVGADIARFGFVEGELAHDADELRDAAQRGAHILLAVTQTGRERKIDGWHARIVA